MKYITSSRLLKLLGLGPRAMHSWPETDKPPVVTIKRTPHYAYDTINRWLALPGRAIGFKIQPTLEQLLSGELVLVRREDATITLTATISVRQPDKYVMHKIATGRLPALHLQERVWVLSKEGVENFLREREEATDDLKYSDLEHIVGLERRALGIAANQGMLERVTYGENRAYSRITRKSAIAFVRSVLPETLPISPEEWIEDRETSQEPLVSVFDAAKQLGCCVDEMRKLLRQDVLLYIKSANHSWTWISPDSLAGYKERQPPLTTKEKAGIFGVAPHAIAAWHRTKLLVCPLHKHDDPKVMYRWCMVAFLGPLCCPGLSAPGWVGRQLRQSRVLWQEQDAASYLGCGVAALTEASDRGELTYITTPTGKRVYVRNQIMKRR